MSSNGGGLLCFHCRQDPYVTSRAPPAHCDTCRAPFCMRCLSQLIGPQYSRYIQHNIIHRTICTYCTPPPPPPASHPPPSAATAPSQQYRYQPPPTMISRIPPTAANREKQTPYPTSQYYSAPQHRSTHEPYDHRYIDEPTAASSYLPQPPPVNSVPAIPQRNPPTRADYTTPVLANPVQHPPPPAAAAVVAAPAPAPAAAQQAQPAIIPKQQNVPVKDPYGTGIAIPNDSLKKCIDGLKQFEEYRAQVGEVKNNSGPIVLIERMKLLLKPYNALRTAEASVMAIGKQISEPPNTANSLQIESLNYAIDKKRQDLEQSLQQLASLQRRINTLSQELNSLEAQKLSNFVSKIRNAPTPSSKAKQVISNVETQLQMAAADLTQCLEVLITWVSRLHKHILEARKGLDQIVLVFMSNESLSVREDAREQVVQKWDRVHRALEHIVKLQGVLQQWGVEMVSQPHNLFTTFQTSRFELLAQQCSQALEQGKLLYCGVDGTKRRMTVVLYNSKCARHIVPEDHHENSQRFYDILVGHSLLASRHELLLGVEESQRLASFDELLLAHSQNYINGLKDKLENAQTVSPIDNDTYISPDSLQSILAGSGTVLQAVDLVMDDANSVKNVFCIVRPPGHHAGRDGLVHESASQGFCLVNNIAIGAFYALKNYPDKIKRVAIIDIDVHHGDGTQQIVAGHDDILFISLHAYDGDFYPRTGNWEEGVEVENVFNIPLELDFGSEVFFRAFMSIGYPAICQFKPDLIMISAGFDARKGDTLTPHRSHKGLLEEDYYKIAEALGKVAFEICEGRLVSALEGGYGTEYLAQCTVAHTCGLMDSALVNWFETTHWKAKEPPIE